MAEEKSIMEKVWKLYEGKVIKVFFQDGVTRRGNPHISKKEGLFKGVTNNQLFLETTSDSGKKIESVPVEDLKRTEEVL